MTNTTKNLLKKTPLFTLDEKRANRLKQTILTSALFLTGSFVLSDTGFGTRRHRSYNVSTIIIPDSGSSSRVAMEYERLKLQQREMKKQKPLRAQWKQEEIFDQLRREGKAQEERQQQQRERMDKQERISCCRKVCAKFVGALRSFYYRIYAAIAG